MNNQDFLIKLVIRARNETAEVINNFRKELGLLEKDLDRISEKTGNAIGGKKVGASDSGVAKSIKDTKELIRQREALARKTQDLQSAQVRADEAFVRNSSKMHDNGKALQNYLRDIENLAKKYREMADARGATSSDSDRWRRESDSLRDYGEELSKIDRQEKELDQRRMEAADEVARINQRRIDAMGDQENDLAALREQALKRQRDLENRALVERLESEAKMDQAQKAADTKRFDRAVARVDEQIELRREIQETAKEVDRLNAKVSASDPNNVDSSDRIALSRNRDRLRTAASSNKLGANDSVAIEGIESVERADKTLRGLSGTVKKVSKDTDNALLAFRRLFNGTGSLSERFAQFDRDAKRSSANISRLDNSLRGLLVFGALVFLQQLATGLVALAGAATAAATSVGAAASAIAGALTSGAAQAIPVVAALGAAFYSMQTIFDALKKNKQVEIQDYTAGKKAALEQADATDAVSNANDSLRAAQEGLADSRRRMTEAETNLTTARKGARDELRELINAERDADLAAQGAALNQEEAQRRLRAAIAGGDILETQQAQLNVEQSVVDVSKSGIDQRRASAAADSARKGGLEKLPNVTAAKEQLADAQRAMQNASRAAAKAEQGVEKAAAKATGAAAGITASQGALDYALENMSESQRKLYNALQSLWDAADSAADRLGAPILNALTDIAGKAQKVLGNEELFNAFLGVSQAFGDQLNKIFDGLFNEKTFGQLEELSGEAEINLGYLGDSVVNLGQAFLNLGIGFAPVFRDIVKWIERATKSLRDSTEPSAEFKDTVDRMSDSLKTVGRLFSALGGLIAATFKSAALEEGNGLIDSLTGKIKGLTEYMKGNPEAVDKYFKDSADGTRILGEIVLSLIDGLRELFNIRSLQAFENFLSQVLIPAFVGAAKVIGFVTIALDELNSFLRGIPFKVLAVTGTFLLLVKTFQSFIALGVRATAMTLGFAGVFAKLTTVVAAARGAVVAFWTATTGTTLWTTFVGRMAAARAAYVSLAGAAATATAAGAAAGAGPNPLVARRNAVRPTPAGTPPAGGAAAGGMSKAGVAGVVAAVAGAVLISRANQTDGSVRGLQNLAGPTSGRSQLSLDSKVAGLTAKQAGSDFAGLRIADGFTQLARLTPLAGMLPGERTLKQSRESLSNYGNVVDKTFEKLKKARNVPAIRVLIEEGKALAKQNPELAKSINPVVAAMEREADAIQNNINKRKELRNLREDNIERGANSESLVQSYRSSFANLQNNTGSASEVRANLRDTLSAANDAFKPGSQGNIDERAKAYEAATKAIRKGVTERNIDQKNGYKVLQEITDDATAKIGKKLGQGTSAGVKAYAESMKDMRRATRDAMDSSIESADKGKRKITSLFKETAKALGVSTVDASDRDNNGDKRIDTTSISGLKSANLLAVGGRVGLKGERGADNVAIVARGEAVLNHDQQKYVDHALNNTYGYDLDGLYKGTNSAHGASPLSNTMSYAKGGKTDGGGSTPVLGAKPGFSVLMGHFKKLFGESLYVMSGFRNNSKVYGSGNVSNHASGDAIDISNPQSANATQGNPPPRTNLDDLHAYIARAIPQPPRRDFLWRTMTGGNHYNHIHLGMDPSVTGSVGAANRFVAGLPGSDGTEYGGPVNGPTGGVTLDKKALNRKINKIIGEMSNTGGMSKMARAAMRKLTRKAVNRLAKQVSNLNPGSDTGGSVPSFSGPWTEVMEKIAEQKGWDLGAWKTLVQKESGGNPKAVNPSSGAFGLGQFLGSTKEAYAKYGATSTDGAKQITAMAKYIEDRYGTPSKALQFHLGHNWYAGGGRLPGVDADTFGPKGTGYDVGGVVPGRLGEPKTILAHGGEYIISPPEFKQIKTKLDKILKDPSYGNKSVPLATRTGIKDSYDRIVTDRDKAYTDNKLDAPVYRNPLASVGTKGKDITSKQAKDLGLDILTYNDTLSAALKVSKETTAELRKIKFPTGKKMKDQFSSSAQKLIDKYYDAITDKVKAITEPDTGILAQVKERLEKSSVRRGVQRFKERFKVTNRPKGKTDIEDTLREDPLAAAKEDIDTATADYNDLLKYREEINQNYKEINRDYREGIKRLADLIKKRSKTPKKNKKDRKKLNEAIAKQRKVTQNLRTGRNAIQDIRDENDTELQNSQRTLADAQETARQEVINEQSKRIADAGKVTDTANSIAENVNRAGVVDNNAQSISNVIKTRMETAQQEIQKLQSMRAEVVDPELRATLDERIRSLQNTIVDGAADLLKQAEEITQRRLTRRLNEEEFRAKNLDSAGALGINSNGGLSEGTRLSQATDNLRERQARLPVARNRMDRAYYDYGEDSAQFEEAEREYKTLIGEIGSRTRDLREIQITDQSDRTTRALTTLDKEMQLAEQAARINGTDPNIGKQSFLDRKGGVLTTARGELEELLATARAAGDEDEIERLTQALLDNQIAINDNTLEVKKATGAENAQTFTTTAWDRFRQAIFNGSNGLLPSYTNLVPAMDTGGTIVKNGYAYLHQGEQVVPAEIVREQTQTSINSNRTNNTTVIFNEAGRRDEESLKNTLKQVRL